MCPLADAQVVLLEINSAVAVDLEINQRGSETNIRSSVRLHGGDGLDETVFPTNLHCFAGWRSAVRE